jgi:cytochrome c peroxidase
MHFLFVCFILVQFVLKPSNAYAQATMLMEPISPLPPVPELNSAKVNLGLEIFRNPNLSKTKTISCASCHDLQNGGMDGRKFSFGIQNAVGNVNSISVFNSSLNFKLFWNGRANSLEEQVDGPVHNPKEMGMEWEEIIQRLKKDPTLNAAFLRLYSNGITATNIKDVIATFERSLLTENARIDQYLRGNKDILNEQEKLGYQRFKSFGCIACHQGANIGGNMFQTMGVMGDYFQDRGTPITDADLGRYTVTKLEEDKFSFRVPSLRNVALTAPYFHDGSAKNLHEAVRTMAKYQLGRKLTDEELNSLVAFLHTLTGEIPSSVKKNQEK